MDREDEKKQALPEEFLRFKEAILQGPEKTTLDDEIVSWALILTAWKTHLSTSHYQKQALQLLLPILETYGYRCIDHYREKNIPADLDLAITLFQELVQKSPPDTLEYITHLHNLGRMLRMRYEQTSSLADIEDAIDIFEEVHQQAPDDLACLNNLADAFNFHYNQTRSIEDLEKSTSIIEKIIQLKIKNGQPPYPAYLNLGQVYKELYRLKNTIMDLAKAIHYLEDACATNSTEHTFFAYYLLGFMFRERYTFTENSADLKHAIAIWRNALTIQQSPETEVLQLKINIGATFKQLFEATQLRADLEDAITYWHEVQTQLPSNSLILVDTFTFLGYNYTMRYNCSNDTSDLDRSVTYFEQAVALSQDQAARADNLYNLGNALKTRHTISGNAEDIQRATESYAEAHKIEQDLSD